MSLTDRCLQEQTSLLMTLAPLMCECCADPAVRSALDTLDARPDDRQAHTALCHAMAAHAAAGDIAALLLDAPRPVPDSIAAALANCLDREMLGYLYLCCQCSAQELLTVLHRCTLPPSPDALALLISQYRAQQARELYGLQLLWRLLGDDSIPDPMRLFRPEAPSMPDASGIRSRLINHLSNLEGGHPDD